MDLGVLEGDRDLGGEQLDELELVLRVALDDAEAFEREDARRAVAAAERDADEAAVEGAGGAELVDPPVRSLVKDEDRLIVADDPRREALLTGCPRLEVFGFVDTAGCQRREETGHGVDDLDRDVVVADELGQTVGDLVEDGPRLERRQDRLRHLEETALVDELSL